MSFRQVYYTSCTKGLRETRGFQIHAATPGIDKKLLDAVERLSLYTPPPSFPTRPTDAELATFPVSLLYEDLGGGTLAVARSKYVGTDYSGRFGNYFTHTLLGTQAEFLQAGVLPVELWESRTWVARERDDTTLPELVQPQPGSAVTMADITAFLRTGQRGERLLDFLACVEKALETRRRIILVDQEPGTPGGHAAAMWIAAACQVLPRRLALQLTFNTYVKNPHQSSALICGLMGRRDAEFAFANHEVNQQFYVFDFLEGVFTAAMPGSSRGLRRLGGQLLEGGQDEVKRFMAWVDQAAPASRPADLEAARVVFAPGQGSDLSAGLRWAGENADTLHTQDIARVFEAAASEAQPPVVDLIDLHQRILGDTRAQAIEPIFLDWFFRYLLPRGPVDQAARAWRVPSVRGNVRIFWPDPLGDLARAQDARRYALMLRVAADTGILDDVWERVGAELVAPRLIDTRHDLGLYDDLGDEVLDRIATGVLAHRPWKSRELPRSRAGEGNRLLKAWARCARRLGHYDMWLSLTVDLHRDESKVKLVARLVSEAVASRLQQADQVLSDSIGELWARSGPTLGEWRALLREEGLQPYRRTLLNWAFESVCERPSWREELEACDAILAEVGREAPELLQSHPDVREGVALLIDLKALPLTIELSQEAESVWRSQRQDQHRDQFQDQRREQRRQFQAAFTEALSHEVTVCKTSRRYCELVACARVFFGGDRHLVPHDVFQRRLAKFSRGERQQIREGLVNLGLVRYLPLFERDGTWWERWMQPGRSEPAAGLSAWAGPALAFVALSAFVAVGTDWGFRYAYGPSEPDASQIRPNPGATRRPHSPGAKEKQGKNGPHSGAGTGREAPREMKAGSPASGTTATDSGEKPASGAGAIGYAQRDASGTGEMDAQRLAAASAATLPDKTASKTVANESGERPPTLSEGGIWAQLVGFYEGVEARFFALYNAFAQVW